MDSNQVPRTGSREKQCVLLSCWKFQYTLQTVTKPSSKAPYAPSCSMSSGRGSIARSHVALPRGRENTSDCLDPSPGPIKNHSSWPKHLREWTVYCICNCNTITEVLVCQWGFFRYILYCYKCRKDYQYLAIKRKKMMLKVIIKIERVLLYYGKLSLKKNGKKRGHRPLLVTPPP